MNTSIHWSAHFWFAVRLNTEELTRKRRSVASAKKENYPGHGRITYEYAVAMLEEYVDPNNHPFATDDKEIWQHEILQSLPTTEKSTT